MSSTLSEHLVSSENATGVVDGVLGAAEASDGAAEAVSEGVTDSKFDEHCLGQNCGEPVSVEPVDESQSDCCPTCGEQFAELQARIRQIELRLEELLADGRHDGDRTADPNLNAWESSDDPAEPDEEATVVSQSATAEHEEEPPAYTAQLVSQQVRPQPATSEQGSSEPSDVPTWAEAYQSDDVDESVRDYVAQLLQRMSTDAGEESNSSESSMEANRDAGGWEPPSLSDDSDDPLEAKTCPAPDDLVSRPPLLSGTSEPDHPAEEPPKVAASFSTDDQTVANSQELVDLAACDSLGESPDYARAESYSPRSLPPERLANLNEMRELANISATAAIRTFEKGRAAKNAFDRLPLIMVGLSCGLFLLFFATTCDSQLMQLLLYAGVGLSFLAATVAAGQALAVLFRWLATAKHPKTLPVDASNASDATSTDNR